MISIGGKYKRGTPVCLEMSLTLNPFFSCSVNSFNALLISFVSCPFLQFYGMLVSHEEFLKEDVVDFTEGSFLKNLDRRHVRRYQEWLKKEAPLRNGKIGYSIGTLARKIVVIKSFLKWLYEVDYIKIPLHTVFLNNEVRMKDRPDRDRENY